MKYRIIDVGHTSSTNKNFSEIETWQKRTLHSVYPIVYIDAVVFSVRKSGVIRKQAAYVMLGINEEGYKEVLTISFGEDESEKYWMSILNDLKDRGVRDIFVLCADNLNGIVEAIRAVFPMTEYQLYVGHTVRNTLKCVADKDRKEFAADVKKIYQAPDEITAHANMLIVSAKWEVKYPNVMSRWEDSWDVISPMYKFSETVRHVIYMINPIRNLTKDFWRLNCGKSVVIQDWDRVYVELSDMYLGAAEMILRLAAIDCMVDSCYEELS